VARIHTNKVPRNIVSRSSRIVFIVCIPEFKVIKITEVKRLILKILVYSAIKIKANSPALYSTLNPDTNSDSPSARSNGVRLVSARLVINHNIAIGNIIISNGVVFLK
jgi:hypothetical protein